MDFTIKLYKKLLEQFLEKQFRFLPYVTYMEQRINFGDARDISFQDQNSLRPKNQIPDNASNNRIIIIRHDVDRLPENSLQTAMLEHELGIQGTYYFRIVKESFNFEIMEKISELGHEIGYHYEDIDLVLKQKGLKKKFSIENLKKNPELKEILIDLAYESFVKNLEMLRKHFDIKTICMHGSPRSKYDNKLIWTKYDYRELGIIGEPYFDIDFQEVAYYTDTGRRWDGEAVSVRDKVISRKSRVGSKKSERVKFESSIINKQSSIATKNWPKYRKTQEMIQAIEVGDFPQKAMITVHPQRWTNQPLPWIKELVWQSVKNAVKYFIVKRNRAGG